MRRNRNRQNFFARGSRQGRLVVALCCLLVLAGVCLGAEEKKRTREEIELIEVGPNCVTAECHPTKAKMKFLHGPINFGKCDPCHTPIAGRHLFESRPKGRALCLACHELQAPMRNQHKPFTEDCLLCHVLHESDERYFVKGGNGLGGCQRQGCHEDFKSKHSFSHAPVEKGGCLTCHTPHQSDQEKLLTHASRDLCLLCHVDFPSRLRNAVSLHEPAVLNACSACHAPHGGETKAFVPPDERPFCGKCHESVLSRLDELRYPHGAMLEKRSCGNCHQPHAAARPHLLGETVSTLCLACHDKPVDTGERMLTNIEEQLRQSRYLHGPVRQGNCVACHQAHGSNFPSILPQPFPSGFYTEFERETYAFCYDCHDRKIIEQESTTLTGFRNGDRNLHRLHVVLKNKGRSCRACHHEHASNQPKHIRTEVAYGQWQMPLEFNQSQTGGGCLTPCHPTFRYDRTEAVQNKQDRATLTEPARPVERSKPETPTPGAPRFEPPPLPAALPREQATVGASASPFALRDTGGALCRLDEGSSPTLLLFLNPSDAHTTESLRALDEVLGAKPSLKQAIRLWIIVPRAEWSDGDRVVRNYAGASWRVLLDSQRAVFSAYKVIATPTAVLLGPDRRILSTHPGYDLEMAGDVRRGFERVLAPKASKPEPTRVSSTEMTLQMARRLAARGLWESALEQYLQVQRREGLSPEAQIELAEVYLKLPRLEDAIQILERNQEDPNVGARARQLLQQVNALKAGSPAPAQPPAVTR